MGSPLTQQVQVAPQTPPQDDRVALVGLRTSFVSAFWLEALQANQ